jgi:hypothetical protein
MMFLVIGGRRIPRGASGHKSGEGCKGRDNIPRYLYFGFCALRAQKPKYKRR